MKRLIILRKKAFAGSLLPYWVIVGFRKDVFMQEHDFDKDLCEMSAHGTPIPRIDIEELDRIGIRINNGQVKEILVADEIHDLFVSSMNGCLSNEINVDECLETDEGRITIKTKGGFKNLSCPVVEYKRES